MARKKVATGKKKSIGWYLAHDWQLWVMLLPAIIYIFIFCYVPMYGVQLAFREYDFKSGIYGGKHICDHLHDIDLIVVFLLRVFIICPHVHRHHGSQVKPGTLDLQWIFR